MKSINLQRTESLLMELVPEALATLNDSRINALPITAVNCKNGKYDAIVYFDGSDYNQDELKVIDSLLFKASGRIKSFHFYISSEPQALISAMNKDDAIRSAVEPGLMSLEISALSISMALEITS